MEPTFRLLPEQASTTARAVDHLYFFLVGVAGFFTLLIAVLIIAFAIHYRSGAQVNRANARWENLRLEIFWAVVPLLLSLGIFTWGAKLYFVARTPPPNAMPLSVVAKQWMWKLQHPEGKREINTLHVPLGQPVKLRMISEDVIHSFFVPAFRVKMDVLPSAYTTVWFEPTKTGTYHLFCAEYCGTSHAKMRGRVIVQEPDEYARWLSGETGEPPEVAGERLFERFRCDTCHKNAADARCPPLEGIVGRKVRLKSGATITADANYIRESILRPKAKIVAGFKPVMPTFEGQLTEDQILQLIAYLKSISKQPPKSQQPPNENE